MSNPYEYAIVITGGASGIGAACAREALRRDWLVALCDIQPIDKVPSDLLHDHTVYGQVDVRDAPTMEAFHHHAITSFRDHNVGTVPKLGVLACAGISRRGDPEQIRMMEDVNEGGTMNLLWAFANELDEHGVFMGLTSIVAAEGMAVKGDEEYMATKKEVIRISIEEARDTFGVRGIAVAPGAIDTPMTRDESIFAMLLLGAAQVFGKPDHPMYAKVVELAGVPADSTPATIFEGLLGPELTGDDAFRGVYKRLAKDPELAKVGKAYLVYSNVRCEDGKIHPRAELIDRAANILSALDIVIGPETVAEMILDQIASGEVPADGLMRIYSRGGENRIRELLGSISG